MSVTVVQQIERKVATRVESVTPANGYAINVRTVVRPGRNNQASPLGGQVFLARESIEQDEAVADSGGLVLMRYATFSVVYWITATKASDTPLDELRDIAIAEIERAIVLDWYQNNGQSAYGGLARTTELLAPQDVESTDGALPGVQVQIKIGYMHTDIDPFTAL